jgi:serine/threonine protein kinase
MPGGDVDLHDWLRSALTASGQPPVGAGYQAAVRRIAGPDGDIVVKSPHSGRLLGLAARATVAREHLIYERLRGVPGVARSFGLLDGRHLILEHIEGPSLKDSASIIGDREAFFDKLLATIIAMHEAGVAHGDLKRKYNVLIGPDETPYVIDFGIACIRKTGPFNRWWFEWFRQMDLNAYIKLKYGRRPVDLLPGDAELYSPLWIERVARWIRIPWQKVTLRRPRQRWRKRRGKR